MVLYAISIHIRPELKQYQATNLVETNTLKAKHVIFPAGTQLRFNIETTFENSSRRCITVISTLKQRLKPTSYVHRRTLYFRHFNIETASDVYWRHFNIETTLTALDVVLTLFQSWNCVVCLMGRFHWLTIQQMIINNQ